MQIHSSSAELQYSSQSEARAATKIQAGFRGYRVRKQLCFQCMKKNQKKLGNKMDQNRNFASTNNTKGNQYKNEYSPESSKNDSSFEEQCATKIQAGVRGYLVRKKQKLENDAATKIQAGFRGFKARQEAQKLKQQ